MSTSLMILMMFAMPIIALIIYFTLDERRMAREQAKER